MKLNITNDNLTIKLDMWEKIFSLHGDFEIPLKNISKAEIKEPEFIWRTFRLPGSYLPGVIKAGHYWTKGEWEFWLRFGPKNKTMVIHLKQGRFRRINIGIDTESDVPPKLLAI